MPVYYNKCACFTTKFIAWKFIGMIIVLDKKIMSNFFHPVFQFYVKRISYNETRIQWVWKENLKKYTWSVFELIVLMFNVNLRYLMMILFSLLFWEFFVFFIIPLGQFLHQSMLAIKTLIVNRDITCTILIMSFTLW